MTRKRMKAQRSSSSITRLSSPRSSFLSPHSQCNWFDRDVWTEIAKFLDGKCLMKLATTSRWFNSIITEECIWKFACLRDLQVPPPDHVAFTWIQLYAAAFDGCHSYSFRHKEKHIDWMRIGAFFFDSSEAYLTDKLSTPRNLRQGEGESAEKTFQATGGCILSSVKTGIWLADLQLVRCPVCNLESCEGTMQMLDARHFELFLQEEYKNGAWDYEEIGSRRIEKRSKAASGGIFDVKYLETPCTRDVFNTNTWIAKPNDWQPKARIVTHAVAINTNLQENEGLHVKYQAMKDTDGKVVSIRISQQLI